jgi:hypothetical protein
VCHQLGYPHAIVSHHGEFYGQNGGPVWMDELNCEGLEPRLQYCSFSGWNVTGCAQVAGVLCNTECTRLTAPADGHLFISGSMVGSVAEFSCKKGYMLVGSSSRACQKNGQWSGNLTVCTGKSS